MKIMYTMRGIKAILALLLFVLMLLIFFILAQAFFILLLPLFIVLALFGYFLRVLKKLKKGKPKKDVLDVDYTVRDDEK